MGKQSCGAIAQEAGRELGLKEGDELKVVAARNGAIEVETKEGQRRRPLDRMAARNWTLPEDYRFDRDEANER